MKKGQTATEYLIILAVVIIIALIVVGVMGLPALNKPDTRLQKLILLCDSYGMKYSGVAGNVLTCNQHKEMAHYNISSPVTFTYDEAWLKDATNATITNISAT